MSGQVRPPTESKAPSSPRRTTDIAVAAAALFQARGYDNVSIKDVADQVGITAPAIYRHFEGKRALLFGAITSALDLIELAVAQTADAPSLERMVAALTSAAVERHDLWVLIRREAMNLDDVGKAEVRRRWGLLEGTLRARILDEDPELSGVESEVRARAAFASLAAPSQYVQRLGRRQLESSLFAITLAVCRSSATERGAGDSPEQRAANSPFDASISRREELLDAAAKLFAARGYQDVSMDEIGASLNITGPTIYHYYASKSELLVGILRRALDWIELDRTRAMRGNADPELILRQLVSDHVDIAIDHGELFQIFTRETIHLPEDERGRVARGYQDFIGSWIALLARVRPKLSDAQCRLLVSASLCVIAELGLSRTLRHTVGSFRDRVTALATGVLWIEL